MNQLMQADGDLDIGQRLAMVVEELQVRHESQRIGHRDDSGLDAHPVPSDACRESFGLVAPERLAAAHGVFAAEVENARAEVRQLQLRRPTGLPQYGRPGANDPRGRNVDARVDDGYLIKRWVVTVWQGSRPSGAVRVVRVPGGSSRRQTSVIGGPDEHA